MSSPVVASFVTVTIILTVIVCTSKTVDSSKILVLPIVGKSHVFSMVAIADSLAARGHSVTVVVDQKFPLDEPEVETGRRRGIHYERTVDLIDDYDAWYENWTRKMLDDELNMKGMRSMAAAMATEVCRQLIVGNEPLFRRLEAANFDLALVDGFFFMKCLYLIPHRLRLPIVSYSDVIDPLLVRVPWLPSLVPSGIQPFTDRMSFIERLQNTATLLGLSLLGSIWDSPTEVFDDYQRYGSFRTLDDIMAKSLLWLVPKDHVLDYPRPTMPNVVMLGGLTVKRTNGELPADLRKFVEGARNGVIAVSFGSTIPSFPRVIVDKFFDAFQRLDADGYRVIWRLKNNDGVPVPENVLTMSWLPQNDLLGHPATKLFITHCGNNGQYEAIYNGVPMIGFPLLGDQVPNARRLEYKGYGVTMNIFQFTADEFLENIRRVVTNRTYAENVRRASEIFRSTLEDPAEKAAYWIDHVVRFGGDHLRSGGQDLPLYAYLMFDVVGVVLAVVGVVMYLLIGFVRFVWNRVWRPKPVIGGSKAKAN